MNTSNNSEDGTECRDYSEATKTAFQNLSDRMGDNQFADIYVICMDCRDHFTLKMERTGPNSLAILNGAIGVNTGMEKAQLHFKCDKCKDNPDWGTPSEVYSRVVGYLRPVSSFNDAKQVEYGMRSLIDVLDVPDNFSFENYTKKKDTGDKIA